MKGGNIKELCLPLELEHFKSSISIIITMSNATNQTSLFWYQKTFYIHRFADFFWIIRIRPSKSEFVCVCGTLAEGDG